MTDGKEFMYQCPRCGRESAWRAEAAGRPVECGCGASLTVPFAPGPAAMSGPQPEEKTGAGGAGSAARRTMRPKPVKAKGGRNADRAGVAKDWVAAASAAASYEPPGAAVDEEIEDDEEVEATGGVAASRDNDAPPAAATAAPNANAPASNPSAVNAVAPNPSRSSTAPPNMAAFDYAPAPSVGRGGLPEWARTLAIPVVLILVGLLGEIWYLGRATYDLFAYEGGDAVIPLLLLINLGVTAIALGLCASADTFFGFLTFDRLILFAPRVAALASAPPAAGALLYLAAGGDARGWFVGWAGDAAVAGVIALTLFDVPWREKWFAVAFTSAATAAVFPVLWRLPDTYQHWWFTPFKPVLLQCLLTAVVAGALANIPFRRS